MDLLKLRSNIVLIIIASYLVLNSGFMLLRLPPSGSFGIPIAELLIAAFLATLIFEVRHIKAFATVAPLTFLLIWWGHGGVQAVKGLQQHSIWALRDASHMIDSLFIWIGFVVASVPGFLDRFSHALRLMLIIGAIYMLGYPFRDQLAALSPTITAPAGYSAPILFNYTGGSIVPMTAAVQILLDRTRLFFIPSVVVAGGIIAFAVVLLQQRSTYLQLIALFFVLAFIRPRDVMRLSFGMVLAALALVLILSTGIEITGRLGEKFSLDFLVNHFAAIWGEKSGGAIDSAASGVGQRLAWWTKIWEDVTVGARTLTFGLGYGIPLTDFSDVSGTQVREPHNSTISTFARLGLIGIISLFAIQAFLAREWFRLYKFLRRRGDQVWANNLLIMAAFFISVWVYSIGEDAFEKPFSAVPYYFFWGVILRAAYVARLAQAQEPRTTIHHQDDRAPLGQQLAPNTS
ncbi:MAG: O-antigen ligase family protein [Hyphomicrobiaceae bacterium]